MRFPAILADPRRLCRVLSSPGATLATLARVHAVLIVSASHHLLPCSPPPTPAPARSPPRRPRSPPPQPLPPPTPASIAAWNALLTAYSCRGAPADALRVFRALPLVARPDSTTFTLALSACARLGDLATADPFRDRALAAGYGKDVFVCSALLHLYTRCGGMDDAFRVFEGMQRRDYW